MIVLGIALSVLLVGIILLLTYSFAVGIIFGAPYLPTMRTQRQAALKLLDLKPGQTLYDLGCGDGRMLRLAAESGLNAVGYEISPIFYAIARLVNFRYRRQVKVILGNYWAADLSGADGIFVFLLDKYMPKLDKKVTKMGQPTKLASYTFRVPGKKPTKISNGVYLYDY